MNGNLGSESTHDAAPLTHTALSQSDVSRVRKPTHDRAVVRARARSRLRRRVGRGLGARLFLIILALALFLGVLGLSGRPLPLPVWMVVEAEHRLNGAVSQFMPETSVSIGTIDVTMDGDWVPRLRLSDVRLLRAGGQSLLTLPETRLTLDPGALMLGRMQARTLSVTGARIALRRDAAGRVDLTLASGGPQSASATRIDTPAAFFEAMDRIFGLPALANLRTLEADALSLSLTDAQAGRTWTLGDGRFRLDNRADELAGELSATLLTNGPTPARAVVTMISIKGASQARITATVDKVPAEDLAAQTAVLAWLGVLDAPISGQLSAQIDATGLTALDGRLDLGQGALRPSGRTSPLAFDHASLGLGYDPGRGRIVLTGLNVESRTVRLRASGHSYLIDAAGKPMTGPLSGRRPATFLGQLAFSEVSIDPEGLFQAPVQFAQGALDVRLRLDPFTFEVGQLSLTDGDRRLLVSGKVAETTDGWRTALDVSLNKVNRNGLLRLWPLTAVPATRSWVERNLLNGDLTDVKAAFRTEPGREPRLHLGYSFAEASLRVLPTLPPVEGARGYSTIDGQTYTLVLTEGGVTPPLGSVIDVSGSVFSVPDVSQVPARGTVRLASYSELTSILSLLDQPPFLFMTKALLPVTLGQGRARLQTTMSLPLGGKLTLGDVDYLVSGTVTDFSTTVLFPGKTITAAELSVTTTPLGLTVSGAGKIGQVPFDATLTQTFAAPGSDPSAAAALPTLVEGSMTLSQATVAEFGLGLPAGMVSGSGSAEVRLTLPRGGAGRLVLVSDLNRIGLAIPELGWRKSPASRGRLEAEVQLGSPPRVDRLILSGAGMEAAGTVSFRSGGGLDVARFSSVRLNGWLDAPVEITGRGANRAVALAVTGGRVDLRRMPEQRGKSAGAQGSPLTLSLDRLQVADGIALTRLRGTFSLSGGFGGDFRADVNGAAAITGTVAPAPQGTAVRIRSDDAGAVMAAAGVFSSARGGTLDLTLIPRATSGHYDGRAAISDIRVRNANVLAELLNAISVVGILDQLNESGIVFNTADADFLLTPNAVQVTRAAAIGASLGVSMAGVYRTADKGLQLQGVISPIYLVNGVGALISKRGEGLFGFNYGLRGTADAPQVSVNPLSILTPGMFREIFRQPPPVLSSSGEIVKRAPTIRTPEPER